MIINTITVQQDGSFLVNKNVDADDDRQITVPDDMENRHRVMIQEWIDAGNTPTPFAGPTDMELWKEKMVMSDGNLMTRDLEDLVTINNFTMRPEMKIRYDAKIALRATKP